MGVVDDVISGKIDIEVADETIGQEQARAEALTDEKVAIAYLGQFVANNTNHNVQSKTSLERAKLFINLLEEQNKNNTFIDEYLNDLNLDDRQLQLRRTVFEALMS